MQLGNGYSLAYCTNVHRGETWAEVLGALERHVLPVRARVSPDSPYAVGLRLGARAARELAQPSALIGFRRWLDRHNCYVFTMNGFPYGDFHGTRVKEQVYAPDWSTHERLEYTVLLFDLLAQLASPESGGSVSTVPGSWKAFLAAEPERRAAIFSRLTDCARHVAELSARTGLDLHLGLEPEPLCQLETTAEAVDFFGEWRAAVNDFAPLSRCVGVNYDCCHQAVEFEEPAAALGQLAAAGIRLSKIHLSSALSVRPDAAGRAVLAAFVEPTYLHQVVVAEAGHVRLRFPDLPDALASDEPNRDGDEWRIHFHVPLHAAPELPLRDTREHLLGVLDWLAVNPGACRHLEMETYTWAVLPPAMQLTVEDQLVAEYGWTLAACEKRGLGTAPRIHKPEALR